MSSKKALLSKLKKDIQTRRRRQEQESDLEPTLTSVASISVGQSPSLDIPQPTSSQQRHREFLQNLQALLHQPSIRPQLVIETIRIYLTQFPEDNIFHHLLEFDNITLRDFIDNCLTNSSINVIQCLKQFLQEKQSISIQNKAEMFFSELRKIKQDEDDASIIQSLFELNPYIFETLAFEPKYHKRMIRSLIDIILQLPITTSPSEMRKHVQAFIYNHRFDYVLRYLEDVDVSIEDKNALTLESIQQLFENVRSKHLFFQITELIDNKTTNFQKLLQSILFKYIPDKNQLQILRNYLEAILDVIINNIPNSSLEKYFPSKSRREAFIRTIIPRLQSKDSYEKIIRNICIEEFDQPYLFKNAHRINYIMYTETIHKHIENTFTSIELLLYDRLHRNSQEKLDQVLMLLENPEISRPQLNMSIQKYISTQPYKYHKELEKLVKIPLDKVKDVLKNHQADEYIQILKNISIFRERPDVLIKEPSRISVDEMNLDQREIIERTRPYLHDFNHVAIRPVDGMDEIDMYIQDTDGSSNKFFIPNQLFYQHLADPTISKSQKGNVFTLNRKRMTLANVSVYHEYSIQNEDTFLKSIEFMEQQQRLESVMTPLAYFAQFCEIPVLNHQSDFIKQWREKNRAMLESAMLQFEIPNSKTLATEMETSIYKSSTNIGQYADGLSTIVPLIYSPTSRLSSFSKYFKVLLKTNRLVANKLGELLNMNHDSILQILFPEIQYVTQGSDILQGMFQQEIAVTKRRILLDAYSTQFPMRRIPYLPLSPALRSFRTDKIIVNEEIVQSSFTIPESFEMFFQDPISVVDEVENVEVVTEEIQDDLPTEPNVNDPLVFFIETAFEELYNL